MVNYSAFNDIDTINRILDVSALGLWEILIDVQTGVASMYCNDYMLQLLELEEHLPPEECYIWWYSRVDDAFKSYVNGELQKTIDAYVPEETDKASNTKVPFEVEYPWHGRHNIMHVRCRGGVLSLSAEQIHFAGYHQDISKFYNTKVYLQQQVSNFELGCKIANYAVFELQLFPDANNEEYVRISINKIFGETFNISGNQLNTLEWTNLAPCFPTDVQEMWISLLDFKSWSVHNSISMEFTCQQAGESIKWLRLTHETVVNENSQLRLVGYMTDITQQKEHGRVLKEAKDRAESANLAKGTFLANMSHEIRTPMNAVINFADFMLSTELNPRQLDYIQKIKTSGNLMLNVLNDILDFSKIEANKLSLELHAYSALEEFQTINHLSEQWAEKKDITFITSLAEDIPRYIVGDALRIRQVLINLLSNAIKFTQPGGSVQLKITRARMQDDIVWVNFKISDSGIGMTEEQLNKIFAAFTQADLSTTRRFGGTGLGLTISKMLVDMMGGILSIESTIGVGTSFSLDLPFRCATRAEIADIKKEVQFSCDNYKFPRLRCLIAEDHIINQQIITILLSSLKVAVHITNNGQEALDTFLESDDFDCILMDIQMPIMDGYTATQKIREIDSDKAKNIPIFALTAHAIRGDDLKSIACGMDGHLTKPLNKLEICQIFAEYFPEYIEIIEKQS